MMVVPPNRHGQEVLVPTIEQALGRIKGNLEAYVPRRLVQHLTKSCPRQYRCRTLDPVVTTYLFLRQVLHGNTACSHLRHLSGLDFTNSAYCQARARLPFGFWHRLQRAVTGACAEADPLRPGERWHGHEVFLMDGSSFSMPDMPELQEAFGQPGGQQSGCGFPVAHLLVSCQLRTGYVRRALAAPLRTHDLAQVAALHPELPSGAVLVGDRAFCSYAHLALCRHGGRHGVFRAHQKLLIDFRARRPYAPPGTPAEQARGKPRSRWLKRLGRHDQLVKYFKPEQRPAWLTAAQYAALPEELVVREVRYRVAVPGRRTKEVTLVTTLLDARRYSRAALAELYGLRWRVETDLRHLKTTLGLDVLRCQTFAGVLKELAVFVTVYNLVRRVMRQAGRRQGVAAERISFVDALRWLAESRPGEALPRLKVVAARPGRLEPRARKRRPKEYDLLNQPRAVLRQALLNQDDGA
jgi:hypothetical protein